MCTVTFVPRTDGYLLAMNRDEQLTRVAAFPPRLRSVNGIHALCPSEPSGGTWIGVNAAAVSYTLVNWYSIPERVRGHASSRGNVVARLLGCTNPEQLGSQMTAEKLKRVNPFRLTAFFPAAREVMEWRWNRKRLQRVSHPWRLNIWISSGYDELGAQETRSHNFHQAQRGKSVGTLSWLRKLHASHEPERGPYSICMHRRDAATVSYTEIKTTGSRIEMRYYPDNPCRLSAKPLKPLFLRQNQALAKT